MACTKIGRGMYSHIVIAELCVPAAARQLAGKLLGVLSMRMEPARLVALLTDITKKLPLPSAGPAKKFEEAEGALCSAGYLLTPCLAGAWLRQQHQASVVPPAHHKVWGSVSLGRVHNTLHVPARLM